MEEKYLLPDLLFLRLRYQLPVKDQAGPSHHVHVTSPKCPQLLHCCSVLRGSSSEARLLLSQLLCCE